MMTIGLVFLFGLLTVHSVQGVGSSVLNKLCGNTARVHWKALHVCNVYYLTRTSVPSDITTSPRCLAHIYSQSRHVFNAASRLCSSQNSSSEAVSFTFRRTRTYTGWFAVNSTEAFPSLWIHEVLWSIFMLGTTRIWLPGIKAFI